MDTIILALQYEAKSGFCNALHECLFLPQQPFTKFKAITLDNTWRIYFNESISNPIRNVGHVNKFEYGHETSYRLNSSDLFKQFNNYRINKYITDMLLRLNKTDLVHYKVLEPGCGSGNKLRFFSELRVEPENCYGLDSSEVAIELCKKLSPVSMNFQVGSALDMPYDDNTFDLSVCSGLFGCFNEDEDVELLIAELHRVLKRNSVLFVIDLNENFKDMYANSEAVMAKNLRSYNSQNQELQKLLSDRFKNVSTIPIIASEVYGNQAGNAAGVADLPYIDHRIDSGNWACAYSMWVFYNN